MTRMWFHIESNKQELAHEVKPSVIFTEIWWKMANFITQKSMHFNEQHSDWHDLELRDGGRGRDWCCRKLPPRAPSSPPSSPSSTNEGISAAMLQNVTEMRLPLRNQYRETWRTRLSLMINSCTTYCTFSSKISYGYRSGSQYGLSNNYAAYGRGKPNLKILSVNK